MPPITAPAAQRLCRLAAACRAKQKTYLLTRQRSDASGAKQAGAELAALMTRYAVRAADFAAEGTGSARRKATRRLPRRRHCRARFHYRNRAEGKKYYADINARCLPAALPCRRRLSQKTEAVS